ncbi:hypothetical protein INT47_007583 [Mucor saturninus]|uniref:Uncharacterized protein n=1 Tax=Mucor saturninus TaxID=64648 RepID=A0A8H7V623_9FUNG|nr:hypothetical protein INT47_007583 [Mucor saturninus]
MHESDPAGTSSGGQGAWQDTHGHDATAQDVGVAETRSGDEDTSRNPYNVDVHSSSQEAMQNLQSEKDPTSSVPFNFNKFSAPKKCFKLNYQQPLGLNAPSILVAGLEDVGVKYLIMSALLCLYLGQVGYGLLSLLMTSMTGIAAFYMLSRSVLDSLNWQIEKIDGANILSKRRHGESMEWFNCFVEKIWRSIDPQVFAVVEDILEDTISRVAPTKIIRAVKVGDFDLGVQSPRIEKMNIFPPTPDQPTNCIFGEAEFTLGVDPNNTTVTTFKPHVATPPGFSICFKSVLNASADIRGELTKLSGKIRFKLMTAPEPPFVSKVTISFIRAPEIETAVMPITKKLNIMRLPMLKTLVNQGVKLGFASLVEPNSISVDIKPMMIGALIDTNAIGVVKLEVRQTRRKHAMGGEPENSFVTFSLSDRKTSNIKSTRVLSSTSHPLWNENLYQLVTIEDIKNEVYMNVKVWEADKVKADTLTGSISASVKDIVLARLDEYENVSSWCTEERVIFDGWAPIDGKSERESQFLLDFKLTFHPKYVTPIPSAHDHAKTEKAKREKAKKKKQEKEKKQQEKEEKKKQKEHRKGSQNAPVSILVRPEATIKNPGIDYIMEASPEQHVHSMDETPNLENGGAAILADDDSDMDRTELVPNQPEGGSSEMALNSDDEEDDSDDELGERVSPLHTSGILSIKIVKAKDLEILDPEVISFKKRRHPYKLQKAVSPYAVIYINDTKVFRTRSKMCTSNPNWNAVSECFIKNYATGFIRISVKTSIDLEDDPVIGTSIIKISDLFHDKSKKSKESERWISLSDGIGYGRVFLDLKYKPVKLVLPRELSGADVGTLVIDSVQLDMKAPMNLSKIHLTNASFIINVEPEITRELKYNLLESHGKKTGWFKNNLYFPLMMRYRSALYVHLSQRHNDRKVTACLWMKEIYDNDWQEVTIGLRPFTDGPAADELPWGSDGPCGKITLRLKFVPGFSPAHTELPEFTTDMLGADPFQNDITRDKAHLLVRQEGTENYAVNIPSEKKMKKPHTATIADSNPATLISPPKRSSVENDRVTEQYNAVPVILQQKVHYPIIKERERNQEAPMPIAEEREKNQEAPMMNFAMSNSEGRRRSTANMPSETGKKRASRGSVSYELNDRRASRGAMSSNTNGRRASNLTGSTFNSDYRRSSASTGTTFNSESEMVSTSDEATLDTVNRRLNTSTELNTDNNLNDHVEIQTTGYLEAMEEDLENSKISKYSLMRKLTKGRNRFVKKFKTLSQGYNSQTRANKAIVEEA